MKLRVKLIKELLSSEMFLGTLSVCARLYDAILFALAVTGSELVSLFSLV